MSDWSTKSLDGPMTRELYFGSYQILKYLHFAKFGNLYLQLGYVTVRFWVCITRLILQFVHIYQQ